MEQPGIQSGVAIVSSRASCQLKRNALMGCGRPAAGVCVYCGRGFCSNHGDLLADAAEVCARPQCQAKQADLARHEGYRSAVFARNRRGRCGEEACEELYEGQCSKCMGFFCPAHTAERPHHVIQHGQRVPRMGALCAHCWDRRDVWERF
jgi:hypothetical protein